MGRYNPPTKKENAPSVADIDRLKKQGMKPKMKTKTTQQEKFTKVLQL